MEILANKTFDEIILCFDNGGVLDGFYSEIEPENSILISSAWDVNYYQDRRIINLINNIKDLGCRLTTHSSNRFEEQECLYKLYDNGLYKMDFMPILDKEKYPNVMPTEPIISEMDGTIIYGFGYNSSNGKQFLRDCLRSQYPNALLIIFDDGPTICEQALTEENVVPFEITDNNSFIIALEYVKNLISLFRKGTSNNQSNNIGWDNLNDDIKSDISIYTLTEREEIGICSGDYWNVMLTDEEKMIILENLTNNKLNWDSLDENIKTKIGVHTDSIRKEIGLSVDEYWSILSDEEKNQLLLEISLEKSPVPVRKQYNIDFPFRAD